MKRGAPLKRSELVRKTPMNRGTTRLRRCELKPGAPLKSGSGLPPVSRKRIKPVSAKRASEQKIYSKRGLLFLEAHPECQSPFDCGRPSKEVHHRMGRVGALYLDESHWSALCSECHAWAGQYPTRAIDLGLSEKRIGVAA